MFPSCGDLSHIFILNSIQHVFVLTVDKMALFPILLSVVITFISHKCCAETACFADNVEIIQACKDCKQGTTKTDKKAIKLNLDFKDDVDECTYMMKPYADGSLTISGVEREQYCVTIDGVSVNLPATIKIHGQTKLSVKKCGDEAACLTLELDESFNISCSNETEATKTTMSDEAQTTEKVSVIAGSVGAFVLMSIVALIIVCRRRARQRPSKSEETTEASSSEFTEGEPYAYTTVNPAYQSVDSECSSDVTCKAEQFNLKQTSNVNKIKRKRLKDNEYDCVNIKRVNHNNAADEHLHIYDKTQAMTTVSDTRVDNIAAAGCHYLGGTYNRIKFLGKTS